MNLPSVETSIGEWLLFQQCRVMQNGLAVVVAVVVTPEAAADVLESTASDQVAGSRMNRVPRVTDISSIADAWLRPGGRQKLHRTLGIGNGDPIDPAHSGFHQIDGGKNRPIDAGCC